MAKSLQQVNFSKREFEEYVKAKDSCIFKENKNFHFALGPYCLANFKESLLAHITRTKVGRYDESLDGIILAVKNIKVLSDKAAIRGDDYRLHIDLNADCYVFRPRCGVLFTGVVKHIGKQYIGALIYRVFNVNIKLGVQIDKMGIKMNQEIEFRVKNFDVKDIFPFIEGALITKDIIKPTNSKITFSDESNLDDENDSDESNTNTLKIKKEKNDLNGFSIETTVKSEPLE